ncbi:hypothetical protein HK100_004482 [Physocladia obscura]|uniref:Ankyrin repeat protein n=1 Tax=Physocladia obscura TaxID=109957 RepID=A0AAD5SUD9_9FUNG|nr:hypothetical protein HK100_004482 [Physocladia obscura]
MGNCINKSKNKNTVLLDKISLHNIPFQIQATGDNQSKAKFRDLIEPGIVSWIAAYLDPVPGLRLRHLSKEFRAGVSYDIKVAGIQLQRIRTVLHGDDMKLLQKLLQKLCPSVYLGALWISTGMWNQDYCDLVEEFSENELTAMTKPVLAYLKECNIELAKICSIGTLAWACKRKFINLARIFLDQGKVDLAEYVETILIECVGYLEVVKLLVEFGADPNNCIEFAAREGIVEMLRYLISLPTVDPGAGNNEALVLAVIGGHAECVEILLESPKVSPSARNNVPIREAARLGHTAIFRMLMSREGVDVDVDNRYCLRVAFYFKHRDIAYLLLPYHSQKNIDLTMLVGHLGAHLLKRENNLSAIFDLLGTTTDSDSDDDGDAGTQLLTSVFSKSVAKEEVNFATI